MAKKRRTWHSAYILDADGQRLRRLGSADPKPGQRLEIETTRPDGEVSDRRLARCAHCGSDLTPKRVRAWLKRNAKRRFAAPLVCDTDCYYSWAKVPPKDERAEDYAVNPDGIFRNGMGRRS